VSAFVHWGRFARSHGNQPARS